MMGLLRSQGKMDERISKRRDGESIKYAIKEVGNRVAEGMRVVGVINRMDPGLNVNIIGEVLREEVPKALGCVGREGSEDRAEEKWSEVVGRRKRGPRVIVVKEKGGNENVRQELVKCLDPKEGEVRVRNIRRQGRNFVVEVHSEKDLLELEKSVKVREAGFEANGESNLRDPCVMIQGVGRKMEEKTFRVQYGVGIAIV